MRKVIISGAGGFLGSGLVKALKESGEAEVCALTSHPADMQGLSGTSCHVVALDDFVAGKVDCRDSVFVNCLFPTNADGFALAKGLEKMSSVFLCAKEVGVGAFINVSSQSVYDSKRRYPATEDDAPCLGTPYATGKYCSELLCNAVFGPIPHSNIRLASLLGANYGQRIVNRMVKRAFETRKLEVVGGKQRYGFLDVRDATKGLALMIQSDCAKWRPVYNLGPSVSWSLMEVAQLIASTMQELCGLSVEIDVSEGNDERNSALDPSLFAEDFNWQPSISLRETIRDIVLAERGTMLENA